MAMNVALEQAIGERVLFLDDDIIPDPCVLKAHVNAGQRTPNALLAGRVIQPWHTDEPEPEDIVARPRFRFFWGGRGCSNPLGACVIIPLINGEESNTDFIKLEDKAVILPKTDDNGLTYDGYFPVYSDLDIPIEVVNELGLSKNKIMAGIYQAYYDSTLNKYTGIVVDLN
jgi:glycosyltransferase involved in cell wall biosynthesis